MMTDDLIIRAEAIAAIQAAGGGYIMAMEVISALPAADMSSPLGAVAMRDAAIAEIDCGGCYGKCVDLTNCRLEDVSAIRALPTPDHAAMLAAALRLPEVAAVVGALQWYDDPSSQGDVARTALAALEAKHG